MNEIFSVIIVHYNQIDYLYTAIDSVLCQNYPSIQLIVADDGSIKFPQNEIIKYIAENKKSNVIDFKVIHHALNEGIVKNVNDAYTHCIGKYITQFAADDVLYDKDVLRNFAENLNTIPQDVFGVFGRSLDCDEQLNWDGKREYVEYEKAQQFNSLTADEQYSRLVYRCDIPMGATAFLAENFKKVLPLDLSYRLLDDWPLMLRVTRNGNKFMFADFKALLYRAGGVSRPLKERKFTLTRYICQDHLQVFDKEILPYSKKLTLKELADIIKRYDQDRKWMKRAAGEFESKKRIEMIKSDRRALLVFIRKIISYQGLLTAAVGGGLFGYAWLLLKNHTLFNYPFSILGLFFLSCSFIMIVLQDMLLIKRYLFNSY